MLTPPDVPPALKLLADRLHNTNPLTEEERTAFISTLIQSADRTNDMLETIDEFIEEGMNECEETQSPL